MQEKVHHCIGALITPQQLNNFYTWVYAHDTADVERATTTGNDVSQQHNPDVWVDLVTAITQTYLNAQTFRSLYEGPQRGTPQLLQYGPLRKQAAEK